MSYISKTLTKTKTKGSEHPDPCFLDGPGFLRVQLVQPELDRSLTGRVYIYGVRNYENLSNMNHCVRTSRATSLPRTSSFMLGKIYCTQ